MEENIAITKFNKLMTVLKDVQPSIYKLLSEKDIPSKILSIKIPNDQLKFVALIALMASPERRKELIKALQEIRNNGQE